VTEKAGGDAWVAENCFAIVAYDQRARKTGATFMNCY
jgi:hypothetical protein